MHDSEEIGSRLRDERKRCNLTQDQAATEFGIAKRTQANYEAGASDATATYLKKAWEKGFDVEYILTGSPASTPAGSLIADESSTVGARLREERERLGLKQEDLATPGGVNRNTQGSYERGVRNPDTAYLAGVATLGIDLVYVISGRRVVPEGLTPDEAQIIEQYRSIPSEDQRSIRRFLKAMADDVGSTK